MSDKKNKKPGFFQKLFGMSPTSSSNSSTTHTTKSAGKPQGHSASDRAPGDPDHKKQHRPHPDEVVGRPEPRKQAASTSGVGKTSRSGASRPHGGGNEGGAKPPKVQQSMSAPAGSSGDGRGVQFEGQPQRPIAQSRDGKGGGAGSGRKSRRRKGTGKKGLSSISAIDISKPLDFPTTPEQILARHKAKPFLNKNEEWLLVELNEFECLVDSIDIIKTIAKHSQFFEVEPDELWEEFFEFVEEMPSYDDIINFDVWQEFRDQKYPC